MMSGHSVNPFFFNRKNWMPRTLTPPTHPLHPMTSHFYLTPLPLPPSKWISYVYHSYIYYRNGWWNFSFFAGIKLVGFPSKTMGKNHKDFLRNLKQTHVKLHGINWKTFRLAIKLASLVLSEAWYLTKTVSS